MPNKSKKNNANGKKSPLVLILLLILAVVVFGGGGYLFFELYKIKTSQGQSKNQISEHVEAAYYYVPLDSFTVNLMPEKNDDDHVLFIEVTLKVKDAPSEEFLKKIQPEVRSKLLILFSKQSAAQLATDDGKHQLMEDIKDSVVQFLPANQQKVITGILFNTFIVR